MNVYLLISTIEQMTPEERRRFGDALAKCGVSVVKRLEHPRLGSAKQVPNETPQGTFYSDGQAGLPKNEI